MNTRFLLALSGLMLVGMSGCKKAKKVKPAKAKRVEQARTYAPTKELADDRGFAYSGREMVYPEGV